MSTPANAQPTESLWRRLHRVHPSETDGYRRRVLQIVATWHFVTLPLGPLLAGAQYLAGEAHRTSVIWLVIAPILAAINYRLTLSRHGWRALDFQVASTFALVAAALLVSPDRVATTAAFILPVLAAALFYGLRRVLFIQALSLVVVGVHGLNLPASERGSLIGAGAVLLSSFAIIAAIVRLREHLVEERLRKAREESARARTLLDASFDGIAEVVEGRLTSVSPGFERALGYAAGTLAGREIDDVLVADAGSQAPDSDAIPLLDGQGNLRYITVLRQGLPDSVGPQELVAVRDRTREQIHKANLLFADRMANVGSLAAGVAHEVNNALMTLEGHSGMAQRHLGEGALEKVRESHAAIAMASDRIAACIRQLQRFGDARESPSTVLDLHRVVRATVGLAEHRMRHSTQVTLQLGDEEAICFAEERSVEQILMNLLLNAMHAVTGSAAPQVEVRTQVGAEWVAVRVVDSGPGISPELRARIFQPFFTTKGEQGTGLGLAISASLASRMGGSLVLDAQSSKTTFCLYLPRTEAQEVAKMPTAPLPKACQRVMIVDDEVDLLEVLGELLHPAEVTLARSVEEAQRVWSGRYDLVLSDLVMPDQTGLSLRQWVATHHAESLPQLVLMTGSAVGIEREVEGLPAAQRVVQKPLRRDELYRLLAEVASTDR